MGATWGDFTLVGSQTGVGPGTLTIESVEQHDLIIACSAVATPYSKYSPAFPEHTATGVSVHAMFSKATAPLYARWFFAPPRWYYYYWPYWPYYWPYWYYRWWYYRYPVVVSQITCWRADSDGDVSVTFSEPSGWGVVFQTALKVWRPNISVGNNEAVRTYGFAESAQGATAAGRTATMPVYTDELLLAMGVDTYYWNPTGNITVSGVTLQELVDFNPSYTNRTARIKLWRVKSTGTAVATYTNCNVGRALMKFVPNVDVYQLVQPVPGEDPIFVEIQAELTPSGRIIRPRWFEALRTEYAWDHGMGLRKRWVREALGDTGGQAKARVIEMWKFPPAANSSIPAGEAYTWVDPQLAEARVIALDQGW